jgi:hypothetical protein
VPDTVILQITPLEIHFATPNPYCPSPLWGRERTDGSHPTSGRLVPAGSAVGKCGLREAGENWQRRQLTVFLVSA